MKDSSTLSAVNSAGKTSKDRLKAIKKFTIEKIGVTGTREGMNQSQKNRLKFLLKVFIREDGSKEFHHGDCVGVDDAAAWIAHELGLWVVSHPPNTESQRAHTYFDEERPEQPYMTRNWSIVDETDFLIGVPDTNHELLRSGTWATIRYAIKTGKRCQILRPHTEASV